ncbi:hypothetical protein GCM10010123_10620 [Pilimelia anulata]|uniref:Peptidase S8/S53 domain-containing protein n=1 Tax=Pilimelia anulata TaxID=53371 RepID=A0A8J3B831_9ACTN|nr:S8 family serine peptidase [Pilimelia anulata]GGJ82820.1 hypothetical protein GCM10010123_10620 [Pilimelia anulata]
MHALVRPADGPAPQRRLGLLGGLTAAALAVSTLVAPPAPARDATVDVIVRYDSPAAAQRAVARVGGTVGARLGLIDGLVAAVPATAVARLATLPGVLAATPDGTVRFSSDDAWSAAGDATSMTNVTEELGARRAWRQGITGRGVGVALIDTGVVPVQGLTGAGKVVNGPDLSFESQSDDRRYLDTFGHGTHLAGIIAGNDGTGVPGDGDFAGVAPGAKLINIKVGSYDGAADVSQVIAAIDWVVAHRNDDDLNIRILNLSFGTDSGQDYRLDPLAFAVDAAWRHGIVVATAAGNGGASADLTMPALNPRVLAVGATDTLGTTARGDDRLAAFSAAGTGDRLADVLAAGKSIVSLRDPGSFLDERYPGGVVAGRFFRGSGTSQATAVLSGAAALLLQQRPYLTPDQVKRILITSGDSIQPTENGTRYRQIDVRDALLTLTPLLYNQHFSAPNRATGLGTLEGARGSYHVQDGPTGVALTGEQDIFGQSWNPQVWTAAADDGSAWTGGQWNGSNWAGTGWTGSSWAGTSWGGTSWGGTSWGGTSWGGTSWGGTSWGGRSWGGTSWGGTSWGGTSWGGTSWGGTSWGGRSWGSASWG